MRDKQVRINVSPTKAPMDMGKKASWTTKKRVGTAIPSACFLGMWRILYRPEFARKTAKRRGRW